MKNKEVRGILALVVVTALSFGVILGSNALAKDTQGGNDQAQSQVTEELDVGDAENIDKAYKTDSGYLVTVKEAGYGGDITMDVSFDADKSTITKVEVTEQTETEGVGSKITEPEFLGQFEGVQAPVYLEGMSVQSGEDEASQETAQENDLDELEGVTLQDGTYEAKAEGPDENGFTGQMSMTVKDGKITEVNWDCVDADGNLKSVLSENGEYVMTEDGPTWAEQSEALAKAVIENQSLNFLTMDEQGKTDAVSGVSINISEFVNLSEQCMRQAAGLEDTAAAQLQDGTYEAKAEGPDENGFTGQVSVTVQDGKITEVNWDCVDADGNLKSVLSENGEYVMTEDGPTWAEQSEALAKAVIENQSLNFLTMDEQGKTDAVSGVSINISEFVDLVGQCLVQAGGSEPEVTQEAAPQTPSEGTQVDAVSGATISSTAAVQGINDAYEFLKTVE